MFTTSTGPFDHGVANIKDPGVSVSLLQIPLYIWRKHLALMPVVVLPPAALGRPIVGDVQGAARSRAGVGTGLVREVGAEEDQVASPGREGVPLECVGIFRIHGAVGSGGQHACRATSADSHSPGWRDRCSPSW